MTSLIFFGTIIILLGIIIVCFYNKSFENSSDIKEGFAAIIDSKPVYDSNKKVITYNPHPTSQGYVNQKIYLNNKAPRTNIGSFMKVRSHLLLKRLRISRWVLFRKVVIKITGIDSKPVYDSNKKVITYNPHPTSQGYVNQKIYLNNKAPRTNIGSFMKVRSHLLLKRLRIFHWVLFRKVVIKITGDNSI